MEAKSLISLMILTLNMSSKRKYLFSSIGITLYGYRLNVSHIKTPLDMYQEGLEFLKIVTYISVLGSLRIGKGGDAHH